ncbi:unnamed protein product [Caenorhabditis angaria]|uniref:Uncharacterized protein n=1 Tax=Caenorhabditis angaria TaxID=860376 RepID=A0A9P1NBJ6_9PELO|nr:unnamed protein product [Caenorhabditis angaria]
MSSSTTPFVLLLVLILGTSLVSTCFLNSCPYRRYGRTLRCSSCGPDLDGVCVAEGKCCTHDECYASSECGYISVCPELFCKIGRNPGYCMKKGVCCTAGGCQASAMC